MVGAHGWPGAIAARGTISAKFRRDLLQWLAPLEAMVRRLLLLEALRAPPPCASVCAPKQKRRTQTRRKAPVRAASPVFTIWNAARKRPPHLRKYVLVEGRGFRPEAGLETYPAAPVARRMEALLGVLENRAPHVARLARLITRTPARVRLCFGRYRRPALRVFAAVLQTIQPEMNAALARLPARRALAYGDTS